MNNIYIEESIDNYISYISGVLRFSERTIDAYKHDLKEFLTAVRNRGKRTVKDIEKEDVETFLAQITKSKSGSSANYNRKLSSIKSFFNYLSNSGLKNNIAGDLKLIKNHSRQISYLTEKEKIKLIGKIKQEATPYYRKRDLAIISLFLNVGIRVSELSNLEMVEVKTIYQLALLLQKELKLICTLELILMKTMCF
jgi:site-specific recombinase XerD